jgi:hypothetical protein
MLRKVLMEINHEGANSLELWSANECYSMFHPFIVKANFLQVRENMYQNLVKFFFFFTYTFVLVYRIFLELTVSYVVKLTYSPGFICYTYQMFIVSSE